MSSLDRMHIRLIQQRVDAHLTQLLPSGKTKHDTPVGGGDASTSSEGASGETIHVDEQVNSVVNAQRRRRHVDLLVTANDDGRW
jgi:hypothetical protein